MQGTLEREIKQRRVGVLMGGRSAERAVSLESGGAMLSALLKRGWDAIGVDIGENPCTQIEEAGVEVAVLALHGRYGEDGCMQGLLESMSIPYTGSSVGASAVAMDKVLSKRIFEAVGLPTPRWEYPATLAGALALSLPVVLKPRGEGSSVGLEIVRDEEKLRDVIGANGPLLAEAYVCGRELSVGVLGVGAGARYLGSVEIRPAEGLYDYRAKYELEDTEYLVPAPLPAAIAERTSAIAVAAHRALGCSGATRVDFRWDERGEPMLLEVNTLPGMTSHSLLPKIAAHGGISYEELVEQITRDAALRA